MTSRVPDLVRDVWHDGEKQMHQACGVATRMHNRGAVVVRDAMPDQHRDFFRDQRLIVLCALDKSGHPWPFLRIGPQGFIASSSPTELSITSRPMSFENKDLNLEVGGKVSVLGIEFETKRRNRMNGTITAHQGDTMTISVDQSFGNCPRYIHIRDQMRISEGTAATSEGHSLTPADIAQVANADMLFIASRAPVIGDDRRAGVDVNHRGGQRGFVKITHDQALVIPDYDGNKFFNAIGNILLDPRVTLMFPNFETGDVMMIAGHGEVDLDVGTKAAEFGASRVIHLKPTHILRTTDALPWRFAVSTMSKDPPAPGTL